MTGTNRLRAALFVEGAENPPARRQLDPLFRTWNNLADVLGMRPFEVIVPIFKKHLTEVTGDMKTNGASRGEFLLRKYLEDTDETARQKVLEYPICRRLGEIRY